MIAYRKYVALAVILLLIFAGLYAYKEYNRTAQDLAAVNAQEKINAADMIAAFEKDEIGATKKFAGKTVLVFGNVAEIINQQDTMLNVFLGNETSLSKVSCLMDMSKKEAFKNVLVGNQIAVKGVCTGFLADVEMNRCIIVNEK